MTRCNGPKSERRASHDGRRCAVDTWPIVCAPLGTEGRLHEEDLGRLVDYLTTAGVPGLAVVGNASECHKLTLSERQWLSEHERDTAAGRQPFSVSPCHLYARIT